LPLGGGAGRCYFPNTPRGTGLGQKKAGIVMFSELIRSPALIVNGMFAMSFLCVPPACANDQILALAEPLQESFLEGAPRSRGTRGIVGSFIAGLRLDDPVRPFDPQALRILLGDGASQLDRLCVRVATRDGRYVARAQYRLTSLRGPAPLLDFHSRYIERLKGYTTKDFVMIGVAGSSCEDLKNSQLFVVVDGDATNARRLIVQLHAGEAPVRARLRLSSAAIEPDAPCEPAAAETAAFSAECALRLPTPVRAGVYQLSISETKPEGETAIRTYSLALPALGERLRK
jgi:hypothetical protein